ERGEAPAAMRTVGHVLWSELLQRTPAQAQVLDGPRQAARVRRERQDLADDLELVPGLTVDIDGSRLDLADQLAVGAGAQAVELVLGHEGGSYQGPPLSRHNAALGADPDLPWLPPPGDGQQHLQL